jgi:hypothetical protein
MRTIQANAEFKGRIVNAADKTYAFGIIWLKAGN